jgi:hypothetical protein
MRSCNVRYSAEPGVSPDARSMNLPANSKTHPAAAERSVPIAYEMALSYLTF